MRAFVVAVLLSLAPASGFALVTAPLAAVASAHPARAVVAGCDHDAQVGTFAGHMDAVAGTDRMAMRFTLQMRRPGRRWHRVRVPGFSAWHRSDPGRSPYVYTKRVEGLVGPARYRVRVRFRWLDASGAVLRRARDASPSCRMPDPRPDLRVAALTVRPTRTHYAVTVRNAGHSAAAPTWLELDLGDGGAPLWAPVDGLAAGEARTVLLAGRACAPGATLTATADATDAVDERHEGDDARSAVCP